ncbi:MAG TPA: hypothetical protein DDZ42_02440, partial [Candidatus Rokubacteria bacterium]|nr:hypothetical protein [Candidatus Rokubacteria bacterium]
MTPGDEGGAMVRDDVPEVVVVGAGYVGLTLAVHMASSGVSVLAVDIDE